MPVVQKIFAEGKPLLWEEYFPGTNQTLQMVSIPLRENFISTGLDVTDQKKMEAELQLFRKMEAVGKLAGGIAHDFNNQLTPIMGYADFLEHSITDEALLNAAKHIKTSAQRCADLTTHLLTFAKKTNAVFTHTEIDLLVHETIELLKHSIDKNINLRYELDTARKFVKADSSLLESALLNIALNARDAMPDGGQIAFKTECIKMDAIDARSVSRELQAGEYIVIKISDTGMGMSEVVLQRIFDPFYTTKKKGNGLGLASTYETVQQHGGQIIVSSEEGKGTCFCIYLPTYVAIPDLIIEDGERNDQASKSLDIFVIDDEVLVCELYLDLLTRHNHTVEYEYDPVDALDRYAKEWEKFDIVILDMNLPKMNGLELFKKMKQINPSIKAIICTGYSASNNSTDMLAEGVCDVLQKPFQATQLISLIENM